MSRIKSIKKHQISGETLHNLAVEKDESYLVEGVVVHNCRSTLIPITIFEDWKADTKVRSTDIDKFIEEKKGDGFSTK